MAVRKKTLSNRAVAALTVERDTVFWDRDLTGFGVRVYPSGGKVYVAQARERTSDRLPKRVTVGRHGVLNADEARQRAALIIARIRAGEDPVPLPLAVRLNGGPTVADLAERYLDGTCRRTPEAEDAGERARRATPPHPARPRQAAPGRHGMLTQPCRRAAPAAVGLLETLPRRNDSPWVFPGGDRNGRLSGGLDRAWRIVRASAGLEDVRLHDLRHSFASRALALGETLPMIGKLLGHHDIETTARYAHLAQDSVQEAAERIAGSIASDIL